MTQNQLAFWRDQETRRSNVAKEHLENLKRSNELYGLIENERHNRKLESLASSKDKRESEQWGMKRVMDYLSILFGDDRRHETTRTVNDIMSLIPAGKSNK